MPNLKNGCKFDLYTLDCVYSNVPVINLKYIDYFIWFKLPTISNNTKLLQIDEISNNRFDISFDSDNVTKENKLWIKVKYNFLDLSVGQHTYKFSVLNLNSNDIESYYFSYIIQSDNPDRPYNYMRRKG